VAVYGKVSSQLPFSASELWVSQRIYCQCCICCAGKRAGTPPAPGSLCLGKKAPQNSLQDSWWQIKAQVRPRLYVQFSPLPCTKLLFSVFCYQLLTLHQTSALASINKRSNHSSQQVLELQWNALALLPHCSPSQKCMFRPVSENQSESLLAAEAMAEKKTEFSASHYTSHVEKMYFL